jgi:hypothetical protein
MIAGAEALIDSARILNVCVWMFNAFVCEFNVFPLAANSVAWVEPDAGAKLVFAPLLLPVYIARAKQGRSKKRANTRFAPTSGSTRLNNDFPSSTLEKC